MMKTTFYRIRNKGDKEGSYELCKEGALAQLARGELKVGSQALMQQ